MENLLLIGVVIFLVWIIYLKPKKEEEEHLKKKNEDEAKRENRKDNFRYNRNYKNVCWHCGEHIDSKHNILCSKCDYYFVCNNCGNCLCDNPEYKHLRR